jgi:hypothetical protein
MVARTETLGGACCVRWLQTGHRIVEGRMFRDVLISLSMASRRSRRVKTIDDSGFIDRLYAQ